MIWQILMALWFSIVPFLLHEFGHWIMLKKYDVPFSCHLNIKKGFMFEFRVHFEDPTIPDIAKGLKIALFGAFPPILVFIPLFFNFNWFLFIVSLFVCLLYAFWTIYETWLNLSQLIKT